MHDSPLATESQHRPCAASRRKKSTHKARKATRAPKPKKRAAKAATKKRSAAAKKGWAKRKKKKKLLDAMLQKAWRRIGDDIEPSDDGDVDGAESGEDFGDRLAALEELNIDFATRDQLADYLEWMSEEFEIDISDLYRMYFGYPV